MGTDGPSIDAVLLRWRWREREKDGGREARRKKSDETLHCRALLKMYWKKRELFFYAHVVYKKSD